MFEMLHENLLRCVTCEQGPAEEVYAIEALKVTCNMRKEVSRL